MSHCDFSQAIPGSGALVNSALHCNLLESADFQAKLSAAAAATTNASLNSAALGDMARTSNNNLSSGSDFQERLLAMQLARGYSQGHPQRNTSLGLPLAFSNSSLLGNRPVLSPCDTGDASTSRRSALQKQPGYSSSSTSLVTSSVAREYLQQEMLEQQLLLQRAKEEAFQLRMGHLLPTMPTGAGAGSSMNLGGEGQTTSDQRLHGLSDTLNPDPKKRRFR